MESKPAISLRDSSLKGFRGSMSLFLKDLQALPESAFLSSLGGKARSAADIVYEVNLVNDHIGMVIRGEEPFPWPEGGWIKAPAGFESKAEVIEAFRNSSEKFLSTLESFTEDQFSEPLQTDEGETTRFERARFASVHIWYHSGQLNFIQTLLGDDEWHWN